MQRLNRADAAACGLGGALDHRAVRGEPVREPYAGGGGLAARSTARHSDAEMTNLIGREALDWPILAACLHLYGKRQARDGRKMGHVTRLFPRRGRG